MSLTVLATEATATGHGSGHPNQPTTECSGVLFEGVAADFFGNSCRLYFSLFSHMPLLKS